MCCQQPCVRLAGQLQPPSAAVDDWRHCQRRGASGFVQLAMDTRTGQRYAFKFIQRGDSFDVKTISRELMNQRMCYGHPNIIQLKASRL